MDFKNRCMLALLAVAVIGCSSYKEGKSRTGDYLGRGRIFQLRHPLVCMGDSLSHVAFPNHWEFPQACQELFVFLLKGVICMCLALP